MVAATMRTFTGKRRGLPERTDFAGFEKPQQLRLQVEAHLADLVEEERAVARASNDAGMSRSAPVNAPRR